MAKEHGSENATDRRAHDGELDQERHAPDRAAAPAERREGKGHDRRGEPRPFDRGAGTRPEPAREQTGGDEEAEEQEGRPSRHLPRWIHDDRRVSK